MKTSLKNIGKNYYNTGRIQRDTNYLESIMFTPSDPVANTLLIKKINKLKSEINSMWRDSLLIAKCLQEVEDAFFLAVGKHFQVNDKVILSAVIKALGNETIMDEPSIRFLGNKSQETEEKSDTNGKSE